MLAIVSDTSRQLRGAGPPSLDNGEDTVPVFSALNSINEFTGPIGLGTTSSQQQDSVACRKTSRKHQIAESLVLSDQQTALVLSQRKHVHIINPGRFVADPNDVVTESSECCSRARPQILINKYASHSWRSGLLERLFDSFACIVQTCEHIIPANVRPRFQDLVDRPIVGE